MAAAWLSDIGTAWKGLRASNLQSPRDTLATHHWPAAVRSRRWSSV